MRDCPKAAAVIPVENPLPSDSRFRDDVKYLAQGDTALAGEYKTLGEVRPMCLLWVWVCVYASVYP